MDILKIENLEKIFEDKERGDTIAISGLGLRVRAGEFLAVVGPSGCGKSTLLQLISGLETATNGAIQFNGADAAARPSCGIVFQEYALFPWKSVRSNVEFGPKMRGVPKKERQQIAQDYIRLTGLQGFENHYPNQLSGGMKQRVAIARALANEPDVLLMDEPFAAVDAQLREILQQEILQIWEHTGKTVVFVTHQIEEAVFLADRVLVMTGRPGREKGIFQIDLPRPRRQEVRVSPGFQQLTQRIREKVWEELSANKTAPVEGEKKREDG